MKIYQQQSNKTFTEFELVSYFSNFKGEPCAILEREDGTLTAGPIKYLRTKLPEGAKVSKQGERVVTKVTTSPQDATVRTSSKDEATYDDEGADQAPKQSVAVIKSPTNESSGGDRKASNARKIKDGEQAPIPMPSVQVLQKDVDLNEPHLS